MNGCPLCPIIVKIISLNLQPRHSPTVLNAGFQFAEFWDDRSANLEAQAKEPMLNPDDMGLPAEADLLKRRRGLKSYQTHFPEAFSDGTEPITITSARHSIVSGGYRFIAESLRSLSDKGLAVRVPH